MPNNRKCPQCNSANVEWYDGALGYEAIRCNDCNEETDANSDNHSPRPDRPEVTERQILEAKCEGPSWGKEKIDYFPGPNRPLLGQDADEAQRILVGGRRTDLLKEGKVFDSDRLANSPLFDRKLF